jgi:phosphoenolpyruvate---glycerone phosphotransferase subunit DhaK
VKKIINDPADVVPQSLAGFAAAHRDLVRVQYGPDVIVRADAPVAGKVAIVSGGGSGHEPLHGGYVGPGMLDAAVPGPVFTSPTPDAVLAATQAADGGRGVLHIVKNYTGDILNFETAAELAAAEGIEVSAVVINDDVAVLDSLYTAGRRGVGGTVLLEKITGAAADRGDDLAAITALAQRVIASVRSMGVALSACTVPHSGEPSFDLADDEIEMGIGIHGEPGSERVPLETADRVADRMVTAILDDLSITSTDDVVLLVNGLGATPLEELYLLFRRAKARLDDAGIRIHRVYIGEYVTSLEMAGASITILKLDDVLRPLIDAPASSPFFRQ